MPSPDPATTTTLVAPRVTAIHEAIERAERHGSAAIHQVGLRIAACCDAGDLLTEQRGELRHGEWLPWLADNVPQITAQTARNWMRLAAARAEDALDFDSARGIRHAMIMAGIIPEGGSDSGGPRAESPSPYLLHVGRLERSLTAAVQRRPIPEWTAEERTQAAERLRPVVEIYRELTS